MAIGVLWAFVAVFLLDGLLAGALVLMLRETEGGSAAIALMVVLALLNFFCAGFCIAAIALR